MKMTDMMVDLETLSTRPDAAVIAIGAVMFSRHNPGKLGDEFFLLINMNDAIKHGHVDGGTLEWWLTQDDAARAIITDRNQRKFTLATALHELSIFYKRCGAEFIWSHGANFDEPILHHAYRRVDMEPRWKYSDARDTRTVYDIAGTKIEGEYLNLVKHHALDDAKRQALNLQQALVMIGRVN